MPQYNIAIDSDIRLIGALFNGTGWKMGFW